MTEAQAATEQKFEHWCVVELMGHQRIAGLVTEQNVFGSALMRVDVPEVEGRPAFTKLYGASAIYAVTPVEERIARAVAKSCEVRPVETWQLERLLTSPSQQKMFGRLAQEEDDIDEEIDTRPLDDLTNLSEISGEGEDGR